MKLPSKLNKKLAIIIASACIMMSVIIRVGNYYNIPILGTIDDLITYPVEKSINVVQNKLHFILSYFENINKKDHYIKNLEYENEKLLYENVKAGVLEKENTLLKGLLNIQDRYEDYPGSGANVIGKDPGNWYKSFTIDKGNIAGIYKHDIVLANGGLVGVINDSGPLSSTVLSIIDDRSSISVEIIRTKDTGILNGQIELSNKGLAALEVDINADIVVGDQIITSHISDKFPPGILVGEIVNVIETNNGLVRNAIVKPTVNFELLRYVFLIKKNEEFE